MRFNQKTIQLQTIFSSVSLFHKIFKDLIAADNYKPNSHKLYNYGIHIFRKMTSELLFNYRLNNTLLALVNRVSVNCNLIHVTFHAINLI